MTTRQCGDKWEKESRLAEITPFILTYNEEPNIARCLDALGWATQILVLDSGSTDRTLELVARHPCVQVVQRAFDTHSSQANFALSLIETSWVLSLDADYILSAEFQVALRAGEWDENSVYLARFRQCVQGQPLRRSLYPPRAVLFAHKGAAYEQDGHTQRLIVGHKRREYLSGFILHDDRKFPARWRQNQRRYAELEAQKLRNVAPGELALPDRLRRTGWLAPLLIGPYVLLACGSILDGWPGILYAAQRVYVEALLALYLMRSRLSGGRAGGSRTVSGPVP